MRQWRMIAYTLAIAGCAGQAGAQELTGTLKNIKETGAITLGYRESSIPFSYLDDNQKPVGYAMDICYKIVDAVKKELKLDKLEVKLKPVSSSARIPLMANGTIDPQACVALGAGLADQPCEQDAADASAPHRRLHAEGDLGLGVRRQLGRMQFRGAAHHPILDIGDDDGAIMRAFFGITFDKAVVDEAVEAIMAASMVEPQQVIAQQRQFFPLAQRPHRARDTEAGMISVHVKNPLR